MATYESFAAAQRALDEFPGWQVNGTLRPMTPKERADAAQLIKDRRERVVTEGKRQISQRQGDLKKFEQKLVGKYDWIDQQLDQLEDDLENGDLTADEIQALIGDTNRAWTTFNKQAQGHLKSAEGHLADQDPEKLTRRLYRNYPELKTRTNPWDFPW